MAATATRRAKREKQKMMDKIHAQFKEKIKGMNREQVLWELEKIRVKYNIQYAQNEKSFDNINTEDVDIEIL
jgi:hypothetical protein